MSTSQKPPNDENAPRSTNKKGTPPELIVVTKAEVGLRAMATGLSTKSGASVSSLSSLLTSNGAKMTPVFGNEDRVERAMSLASSGAKGPATDLTTYYKIEADEDKLEKIQETLLNENLVDGAYIKPQMFPPVILTKPQPASQEAPPTSPSFISRQIYLNAAPAGIDAVYAWTRPGGKGQGIRIIDIEGAWRYTHEDLLQSQGGVIGGTPSADMSWINHGTAVIGEFSGDENTYGITGICPSANVRSISIFGNGQSSAKAITDAANALSPGDIILIELHAPGPHFNFQDIGGQQGFIAIEFWPADFAAIVYATSVRGVIVVEAGGNGAENFDDPLYNTRPTGFPTTWKNPFNLANPQSGAIIVGAGAPPPGTHGRDHGPDRSRLDFSNYGSRVDVQGWGREVTTTGYGDLQGGTNQDLWYTDQFSGTSSASPIIVGAIGCVQGARVAAGQSRLTPATAKNLLRTTGSPQQNGPNGPSTQRIGNRPDLRQMIGQQVTTVPLYRYWNSGAGDHFYTTNWAELGAGKNGWGYEGVQCYVVGTQRMGSVPLYRYWNAGITDHFYTTNWAELGSGKYGWGYEGVQCYVYPTQIAGSVPLYRYWNAGIGDHFYTTNWAELGAGKNGWGYEGVQCYVFGQPASPPSADMQTSAQTSSQDMVEADSPESVSGEEPGSISGIPATFVMGTPNGSGDQAGSAESFTMSGDSEGTGQVTGGDSFTVRSSSKSIKSDGSGHVTINVNVNPPSKE
ncbi:MAG: S8 family serine peptidase [Chitinophagaceae bacterium]